MTNPFGKEQAPVPAGNKYLLFDDPLAFYQAMLNDISKAKKYIFLEIYKFNHDSMGARFRDALTKKARDGVDVRVLIDSWGASVSHSFFTELEKYGGQVRFFTKIKFFLDFFTRNHRRNHRKFLVIDDEIVYLGSANINDYCLNWREMMLRLKDDVAACFKTVFDLDFSLYNKYFFEKNAYIRLLRKGSFEVIRDVPSIAKKRISKKYLELIRNARKQVIIETPYFLPGYFLRKALTDAAMSGVEVIVIIPKRSDVGLIDILRNKYLGPLHLNKIKFQFFTPTNLHAKVILIDDETFSLGSPNFDYRSFRYMHEIVLVGNEPEIVRQIRSHINMTLKDCIPFNYERWEDRPKFQRFVEWLLLPFRHLL